MALLRVRVIEDLRWFAERTRTLGHKPREPGFELGRGEEALHQKRLHQRRGKKIVAGGLVGHRIVPVVEIPPSRGSANDFGEGFVAGGSRVIERENAGERGIAVGSCPHRVRRCTQVFLESPRQLGGERLHPGVPALEPDQLGLQLQEPGPPVRPLESGATRAIEKRQLLSDVRGGEVALEPRLDRGPLRDIPVQKEEPRQQPVHVHRRMPVVAAVERRVQHARAPFHIRPGEKLVEAARVRAPDVVERHARECRR